MDYPLNLDVHPACQLALWIAHYENCPTPSAWQLGEIYNTPLYTPQSTGIVQKILMRIQNVDHAVLSPERKGSLVTHLTAITRTTAVRNKTLAEIMWTGLSNSHRPDFDGAKLHGLYLPPNHCKDTEEDRDRIFDLLNEGIQRKYYSDCLWNFDFPAVQPDKSVVTKPLGAVTFFEMFQTSAMLVKTEQPRTLMILQEAKQLGILRNHTSKPHLTDPRTAQVSQKNVINLPVLVSSYVSGNHKCCLNGTCVESIYSGDYCQPVSEGGLCNSMSDACHA